MNANRFTEKLQEALSRAQSQALSAHNQAVDVEHLLSALLEDHEGIASSILSLAGIDKGSVQKKLDAELKKIPQVTGAGNRCRASLCHPAAGARPGPRAEQEAGKLRTSIYLWSAPPHRHSG